MNIVLVCIGNFQEHILININQLILLGHENIYVITDSNLFEKFKSYQLHLNVNIINADHLIDELNYKPGKNIDTTFRNRFWELTSKRLFILLAFLKLFNVKDVIHLENDVLI